MCPITEETQMQDVLAQVPGARAILSRHGCDVDDECPVLIQDMPLYECEFVCHLDDLPAVIRDLEAARQAQAS